MRTVRQFEELAGGVLLVTLCGICALQIVSRYALTSPLAWTEELATTLFAWLVFIGASLAIKKDEHFAVDVFVKPLPPRLRGYVASLKDWLVIAFCLLLTVYGIRLVVMNADVPTPAMRISRAWFYAAVPFGGVLMLIRSWEALRQRLRRVAAASVKPPVEGAAS